MRPSNKSSILDAAVAVIESDGITAVTFDSVAAAAELTRGGIIYHFRSRDELIRALHEHLAAEWEKQLIAACGKPADQATQLERLIAYIRVAANSASRAEIQMLIDSRNSDNYQPWADILERWTPSREGPVRDADESAEWMALLAADGLWVNDAISSQPLSSDNRSHIVEKIVSRLEESQRPVP